jgi:sialic acid synthase SpsE
MEWGLSVFLMKFWGCEMNSLVPNFWSSKVAHGNQPYVIAEIGSNFDQDIDVAKRLIDAAAAANAHAVKFQLFKADRLYPNGGNLYEIFKSIELNPEWLPLLAKHAKEQGLDFLASAFDFDSVDLLEDINVPAHKIASSETTNLSFLNYVASKNKPIFLSTGMCDMVDVQEAVNICSEAGNNQLVVMQCGSIYPLPVSQANLRTITTFSNLFGLPVGFSDHTTSNTSAIVAVGLGSTTFEKHITLSRESKGPDHFYALEPNEFSEYVNCINDAYQSLGSPKKEMLSVEREIGRREGLYFSRKMNSGEVIQLADIDTRRPALGVRARYIHALVGATVKRTVEKDEPITWGILSFK